MASSDESFRSFSYDEVVAQARWFKEDLEKGGWRVASKESGSTFWTKTFPEEEIPIKVLYQRDLPMSVEQYVAVTSPQNMIYRQQWDQLFLDNQVLEKYPDNGGYVTASRLPLKWPFSDREYVLFFPPAKEIDWYGKRALIVACFDAWHPSKPANVSGNCIRATNGANFYVAIADENTPENACSVFGLSHNKYNGWVPNTHIEWLLARKVPQHLITYQKGIIEGCKMLFGKK